MSPKLVTVATFMTPEEAGIARSVLEGESIKTYTEAETTVGMLWYYGNAIGYIKLQVAESDAEQAKQILASKITDDLDRSSPIAISNCQQCGAEIEPGFEACWSCGAAIDHSQKPALETVAAPEHGLMEPRDQEIILDTECGDEMAKRAWFTSVFGLFFFFQPLFNIYSLWLLIKIMVKEYPLSDSGTRNYNKAFMLDIAVCAIAGLFIWLSITR